MGTPDPRYKLTINYPDVPIYIRWMPDRWGRTTWTDKGAVIEIAADVGPEQQTMTLAHELAHLELGQPCKSFCEDNEREAVAWTARYLIPDVTVLGKLLSRLDAAQTAQRLGLPTEAVLDRIAYMTPAEIEKIAPLLKSTDAEPGRMAAYPRHTAPRQHVCRPRAVRGVQDVNTSLEAPAARKKAASKAKTPR